VAVELESPAVDVGAAFEASSVAVAVEVGLEASSVAVDVELEPPPFYKTIRGRCQHLKNKIT
jgi:hypothetical protein